MPSLPGRSPSRLAAWLSLVVVAGLLVWALGPASWRGSHAKATVRVAAAADLARAFPEIAAAFTAETHTPVDLTFGSSGLLARQLEMGAPFDVFAAADLALVDRVIAAGACRADTRTAYARGHLSMWWRADLAVAPPTGLGDLADPRFRRIAIANPESAPYGRAAKEALTASGVWASVHPRLVYGENVQQALQFAQSGNAEVALVGRALACARQAGRATSTRRCMRRWARRSSPARTADTGRGGRVRALRHLGAGTGHPRAHGFAPPGQ